MLGYNTLLRLGIHLAIISSMFACMTAVFKTMVAGSHKGMWSIVGSVIVVYLCVEIGFTYNFFTDIVDYSYEIVAMCMQVFTATLLTLLLVRRR